ncbi:hypothetical protein GCM10023259_057690 [Thermocatellispora tengchongensis]
MAALCAEPPAPAADISDTAPYAAVRRVDLSWSVRVMDMLVCSLETLRNAMAAPGSPEGIAPSGDPGPQAAGRAEPRPRRDAGAWGGVVPGGRRQSSIAW